MENKPFGVIYRITNLINGKFYIGQTIKLNPKKRFDQHKRSKTILGISIKKYGFENFVFQVICLCYNQLELNTKEEFFINKYKSLISENGYNLTSYSNGRGVVHESTKQKISIGHKTKHNLLISRQNGLNSRGKKIGSNTSSNYVGVKLTNYNSWVAQTSINKKKINLGYYNSEIEAAQAYDIAAIKYFGSDAKLNFPELREDYINNKIHPKKRFRTKQTNSIVGVSYLKYCNRWRARLNGKNKYCKTQNEAESYIKEWKNNA
jgi:group I intron endonuclease